MKIGWIGTGVMGFHMAKHLINKGYKLMVYNRTQSKTDGLIDMGAKLSNPKQIASSCDIIFNMLSFPQDMKDLYFNDRNLENDEKFGIYKHLKEGSIIIDHSTNSPEVTKYFSTKFLEKKISWIDAPVSGGDIGAKNGKLIVMCGGKKQDFDKIEEIMNNYSTKITYFGENPSGQLIKLGNQIKIAHTMVGLVESLYYIDKCGLDKKLFLDLIKKGSANSFSLENYGYRILEGDFQPGFYVEHFLKDLKLCLDQCKVLGITLPGLDVCHDYYNKLSEKGYGKLGTQALWLLFNDIKLNK